MTDEIEFSELEPGIYPAQFIACEPFDYDDKVTGEKEYRWRWVFLMTDGSEQDTLTSRNFRPGTNALKLFTGILGRDPVKGDKPSTYFGRDVQIVYGPNKGGKLTITDVHAIRPPKAEKSTQTAPEPEVGPTDELPF
jgi:hypothetical protein